MADAKFSLGHVVATPGAIEALRAAGQSAEHFLLLHVTGAWGDLDREDREANQRAIAHEGSPKLQERVLSSFVTSLGTKLWVITEWDRSVTTLLLPDEY